MGLLLRIEVRKLKLTEGRFVLQEMVNVVAILAHIMYRDSRMPARHGF